MLSGGAILGALVVDAARVQHRARARQLVRYSFVGLTGVVVAAGWAALVSFMLAVAPDAKLRGMLFWLMGDLSYDAPYAWGIGMLTVGLLAAMLIARNLNILARGDLQATALGVNAKVLRVLIYVLASALCAIAVTIAGTIGFIGLVVPHMLRLIGVTDHRSLIPAAALLGGSLLLCADTLARTVIAPQQLPVGVLTALLGVPLFLVLLYPRGAQELITGAVKNAICCGFRLVTIVSITVSLPVS